MRATIKKEARLMELYAKRDAERGTTFKLNPAALKPVTPAIGAVDKRRRAEPVDEAKVEADRAALRESLRLSARTPREKASEPRTAAEEVGWFAKDPRAAAITAELSRAVHARSPEVK
jgi:hypothetical protein